MDSTVCGVCALLEARGELKRLPVDHSAQIVPYVRRLVGSMPDVLEDFYRERVGRIHHFTGVVPVWNDHVGWRTDDGLVTALLHAGAVPVLKDDFGNLYGLDLTADAGGAVYFFDHEYDYDQPRWCAGSTLARCLLLAAEDDQAYREGRPVDWWLGIDPDIADCPRAPAPWKVQGARG